MTIVTNELDRMIDEVSDITLKTRLLIMPLNELADEYGFRNDPRFVEAKSNLMCYCDEVQAISIRNSYECSRRGKIINKLLESPLGRYLVDKTRKELGL